MQVRVRFFAMLRERVDRSHLTWNVEPEGTVGDLWASLCSAFPSLGEPGAHVAFAVNHEYVDRFHRLHDNDEVALIPPVSGGATGDVPTHPRPDRPHRGLESGS